LNELEGVFAGCPFERGKGGRRFIKRVVDQRDAKAPRRMTALR
jgi:hypothetical protein